MICLYDIFCSEENNYRKVVFLVTCFSATLPTLTQQDILYYNNSFQGTIKSSKTRRPNLPFTNPASCLVTSFEPCCARNFIILSINETLNTTMQIVRIVITVLSVGTIAKCFYFPPLTPISSRWKKRTPELALP